MPVWTSTRGCTPGWACGNAAPIWRSYPADGEFTDLGIGGFAAAAVEELVATAREGDAETAVDAQAALALLLRLTDRGAA